MCCSPDPIKVNTSLQNLMQIFPSSSKPLSEVRERFCSGRCRMRPLNVTSQPKISPASATCSNSSLLHLKLCPGCSQGHDPKDILDVGCSTGLSTLKLVQTFPRARRIIAADLSPHMLSVAKYNLRTRESQSPARGIVKYIHAAGENTGLAGGSMDLVSICLTSHELPAEATRCVWLTRLVLSSDCSHFVRVYLTEYLTTVDQSVWCAHGSARLFLAGMCSERLSECFALAELSPSWWALTYDDVQKH